ncbi:MAG TPA: tetratricopeptide repeat protein [Vicinamibacterales bacterium]|nr:tetratricopeptide repeat protein [Vicinamibacterales bacterium]
MAKRKSSQAVFSRPVPAGSRGTAPHRLLVYVALVVINLVIYANVGRFELVNWDDPTYITENPTVLRGLNWSTAWWALTTGHSPYWHPLTWLSHLLDVSLFGTNPGPYHVVSLILHAANTLLLFELLRRATGAPGRSAFVAAAFAAHPLHVESVAWVTERKDVLSTLFLLLTTLAYVGYVRRPSLARYTGVMALFACALMSKPMVVTLPLVLLLLDVWPLGRTNARRLIVEKVPLLALAIATSITTVAIQARVGAMAGLDALPLSTRLGNAAIGYLAYVWKTVWPWPMAAFYPLFELSPLRVGAALAALLAVSYATYRVRRQHPYVWVGWCWYVVTITPVVGFLQAGEQGIADRFTYVPMIGLAIAAAWGAPPLVNRIRSHTRALPAAAAVLVVVWTIAARAQAAHWENSLTLWEHAARVTPRSYIAHENLGQALRERGRLHEALASYERALALAPAHSPGYVAVINNSIGLVLARQGRTAEARQRFAAAVLSDRAFAEARSNLGNALAAEGHANEAIEHYREAIRLKPDSVEPRVGLGAALLRTGRAAEAAVQYRDAIALDATLAQAHNGLGGALATQGDDEGALREYREALRLDPRLPTAHHNLALLYLKRADLAQARRHLEAALSADPGYEPARRALLAIDARR